MELQNLGKTIMNKMGEITGVRVYVSMVDNKGNFILDDPSFDKHRNFIKNFTVNNFQYLHEGDHSIPLSSENIVFFKCTEHFMVVLFNPKGKIGQLLSFHSIIPKYIDSIKQYEITLRKSTVQVVDEELISFTIPSEEFKIPSLSHKNEIYSKIVPTLNKKMSKNEKFDISEAKLLQKCDGKTSLLEIMESSHLKEFELKRYFYNFYSKNLVILNDYYFLKTQCPTCKNSAYIMIPKLLLNKSKEKIRVQIFPENCDHAFLAFIDKDLKIETVEIENLIEYRDSIDFSKLSLIKLISFLGQDLFFNIFHAIFFGIPVTIIKNQELASQIAQFIKRIFVEIEFGKEIVGIDEKEFKNDAKKHKNNLVIDLDTGISIDPYEERELFDFEHKIFKKISSLKDENEQILATYTEFERLIFLLDTILKEIEPLEVITEEDLVKNLASKYQVVINRYEIPFIKKLVEIYHHVNISKKIVKTTIGRIDDFFDNF